MKKPNIFLTIGISLVIFFGALSAFSNQHASTDKKAPMQQEKHIEIVKN